jgi:hypothetical protein
MEWAAQIGFTARKNAELWEGWKSGQCIASIARTLGTEVTAVAKVIGQAGPIGAPGIRYCLPNRVA